MGAGWWQMIAASEASAITSRIDLTISGALFCAALDELEIPWTRPRGYEVAVYRKPAVARLDELVGPKS